MLDESSYKGTMDTLATVKLLTGIYLMTAFNAVVYLWGNINVYIVSYYYFRVGQDVREDSTWILALNSLAWSNGILLGTNIISYFGFRVVLIGSILTFSTSMMLCYYAVQTSFVLLSILIGVLCGLTIGLNQSLQVVLIMRWTSKKRLGFSLCSVMLTQQIADAFLSLILTKFVNPTNIRPGGLEREMFSQPEILDKVPFLFIFFGGIALTANVISSVLVWSYTPRDTASTDWYSEGGHFKGNETGESDHKYKYYSAPGVQNNGTANLSESARFDTSLVEREPHSDQHFQKIASFKDGESSHGLSADTRNDRLTETELKTISEDYHQDRMKLKSKPKRAKTSPSASSIGTASLEEPNRVEKTKAVSHGEGLNGKQLGSRSGTSCDLTVKQIITTKTFFAMAMMAISVDTSSMVLNTYYKILGFLTCPDDDFFTGMGIAMNISAIVISLISGMACDFVGVKTTVIANTTIACLASVTFYLSAMIDKWLYFLVAVLYNGCVVTTYSLILICASHYFGADSTNKVNGMALLSMYITNFALPAAISFILSHLGWFPLFTIVSVVNLIALLAVVAGLEPVSHKLTK